MKRVSLQIMACALAVGVMGFAWWYVALFANQGSVAFRCGMLATASDPYLDGSGRIKLLLNHGARPEVTAEGYSPLSLAEVRGHVEIAKVLKGSQN